MRIVRKTRARARGRTPSIVSGGATPRRPHYSRIRYNSLSLRPPANAPLWLVALHLAIPLQVAAGGAGHIGLALGGEDYDSDYFAGGREESQIVWSPGVTVKYLWSDDDGALPTLGAAINRWEHEVEGDCCGFEDDGIDVAVTALDLLWGNLSTRPNGGYEAFYVFAGVSSIENETDFANPEAVGAPEGDETGGQLGVGFFAGRDGGFSGGFELRGTSFANHYSVRTQISLGYGF